MELLTPEMMDKLAGYPMLIALIVVSYFNYKVSTALVSIIKKKKDDD